MIVRIEQIRNTDIVLVIDEVSKYIGKMHFADFAECILPDTEPIEEDEYLFWRVDKNMLNKKLE
jgi:hypothetical protein